MNTLGCNLFTSNYTDIVSHFPHPATSNNVWFVPDVVHMLKLLRNALGAYDITSDEGFISFRFIEALHKFQAKVSFKFGNKLGLKHISFKRNAMKVSIACETLSESAASSMEYLVGTTRRGRNAGLWCY
jgi:hypothetical protein